MSINPKENQNVGSQDQAASEEDEAQEQDEGEGSNKHRPLGDSDPTIKNH